MKGARITKLITYKTNYTQPVFYLEAIYPNGSETEAYCGITEAQTKRRYGNSGILSLKC